MPVKGKRILVTLSWDTYNTLHALAQTMNRPTASLARELLEDATPRLRLLLAQAERLRAGDLTAALDLSAIAFEVLGHALNEGSDALRARELAEAQHG